MEHRFRTVCKKCHKKRRSELRNDKKGKLNKKNHQLQSNFGISIDEYHRMYNDRNGKCDICGEKHNVLAVDHNHNTRDVRGLLCGKCNAGIGMLNDSIDRLKSAIDYLERNGSYEQIRIA